MAAHWLNLLSAGLGSPRTKAVRRPVGAGFLLLRPAALARNRAMFWALVLDGCQLARQWPRLLGKSTEDDDASSFASSVPGISGDWAGQLGTVPR